VTILAHLRAGAGPRPVVLLHGFLGSARNLRTLAGGLAARDASLHLVALDLRGHGLSPPLPPGADLATLAGDLLDTARDLGLARPLTVVGHSLGARVALRAGLLEPAALAHVTMLDMTPSPLAGGGPTANVLAALRAAPAAAPAREDFRRHFDAAGLPRELTDWLLLNLERDGDGYRWRIDRDALAALHARVTAEDLWPAVEGPRAYGVHAVRGALSPYVDAADVRRLLAAGVRVDTIEGAGHFLHVEQPREVVERVLAGLR
jgi:pimeloyl-ACP methyl ester carboxylesterase